MVWALYGDHGDLDPTARLVLVVLADHAGTEGIAWPSRARIAKAAGCSVDTVDRRTRELVDAGVIALARPEECPAAWQAHRPDRRPVAYSLTGTQPPTTGPQPAATGPQHSGAAGSTGPQTDATGPQHAGHGAAAVRHEPKEPNLEKTRARATPPTAAPYAPPASSTRPDSQQPCQVCRHIHPPDMDHPRRQPADVTTRGAARARDALRQAQQGADQ